MSIHKGPADGDVTSGNTDEHKGGTAVTTAPPKTIQSADPHSLTDPKPAPQVEENAGTSGG